MRADGSAAFFFIQHKEKSSGRWVASALDIFLFDKMSHADKIGEKGDRYSALMDPQSASSALWQKFGIHGFEKMADARACLDAVRIENPDREFRLVVRAIVQHTEVVKVDA